MDSSGNYRGFALSIMVLALFLTAVASATIVNQTLINDSFAFLDNGTWTTDWTINEGAIIGDDSSNYLISKYLDTSDASKIYVSFLHDENSNSNPILSYFDGLVYNNIFAISGESSFFDVILDDSYFNENFSVKIDSSTIANNKQVSIDNFLVIKEYEDGECISSFVNTNWSNWENDSCFSEQMRQSRFLTEYDSNFCREENNTYYDYQFVGPSYINTSVTMEWENLTECLENGTQLQKKLVVNSSDVYGCATNILYYETREIGCDFCTPNFVNTNWSEWRNFESCLADDNQ